MIFFEFQYAARKKTIWLYLLFLLTLPVLLVPIYMLVMLFVSVIMMVINPDITLNFWDWRYFLIISLLSTLIILSGSIYKIREFEKEGGLSLARMLGGKLLTNPEDILEQQLLNIVEEMAVASGVLTPAVFIIEQQGINAFAAGYEPQDTVIAVSRGAIEMLSRDELQAMIAHEFSHILHGDTHVNMKMMGLLYGITMISDFAIWVISFKWLGRSKRSHWYSHRDYYFLIPFILFVMFATVIVSYKLELYNKSFIALLIVFREVAAFAALFVGGFIFLVFLFFLAGLMGLILADIIKSAISRQREYLADASAVQFTRNPEAVVNALKVIGGYRSGSIIRAQNIKQMSHLFFGEALQAWMKSNWWATHPPLISRIQRLDPGFTGIFKTVDEKKVRIWNRNHAIQLFSPAAKASEVELKVSEIISHIGSPDPDCLLSAQKLLSELPEYVRQNMRDPKTAKALVYAILLQSDKAILAVQMREIEVEESAAVFSEVRMIQNIFPDIPAKFRLPLLDIVTPHLHRLNQNEQKRFVSLLKKLVVADQCVHIFEYLLLQHFLLSFSIKRTESRVRKQRLTDLEKDVSRLFSVVSQLGKSELAEQKYVAAMQRLFPQPKYVQVTPPLNIKRMDKLHQAFERLNACVPEDKQTLLTAVVHCVLSDGIVSIEEVEIVRLVSMMLECPMPMLSVTEKGLNPR